MHSISNDVATGSVRLQPTYFEDLPPFLARWAGLEAADCDWPHLPPADRELRALESRWIRWQNAKAEIDADWRKEQMRRLEEISHEINADKQASDLTALEQESAARVSADLEESQKFIEALAELLREKRDQSFAEDVRRVAKAGREIKRQDLHAAHEILKKQGRVRGMRASRPTF